MFSGFMASTWEVASIVAVVAGVVGFFVVLRGAAFVADAVPQGAFTGAAAASLLGVSTLAGLAVASLAGALGISWLGRRGRRDVATALVLVVMLGLGSLFLSFSSEYAPEIYSLLFGEVLGVSATEIAPVAILGGLCVVATLLLFRPLLLSSVMPELAEARGVRAGRMELVFLIVLALATSMTLPVTGALLDLQPDDRPARRGPLSDQPPPPRHAALSAHRPGRGVALDRRRLPDQLAGRLLRRHPRRGLLRRGPHLGGRPPPQVSPGRGAPRRRPRERRTGC